MNRPRGLRGPYGPQGSSPPRDHARKEREDRLTALVQSEDWGLVVRGLNQRRQRVTAAVMLGRQLEEWETRAYREQYAILTALAQNPVGFLLEFDAMAPVAEEPPDEKGE